MEALKETGIKENQEGEGLDDVEELTGNKYIQLWTERNDGIKVMKWSSAVVGGRSSTE